MDNGSQEGLVLRRLPHGGFVVTDLYRPEAFTSELFASSSIDDALQFIREKVRPIGPEPSKDMRDLMDEIRKPVND